MKIKSNFILRTIAGSNVVVPIGSDVVDFNGMISLNETGAFLWEKLKTEKSSDELVAAMLSEYDVDEKTAKEDVADFIKTLTNNGLIEE